MRPSTKKTPRLEISCKDKRRYFSETDALVHAAFRAEHDGVKLRTYRCAACQGWHLTEVRRASL